MTPIKDFLIFERMIYIRDHADFIVLCAVAPDDGQMEWLANTLSKHHGKPWRILHAMPGMRLSDDQLIGSD